MRFSPKFVDQSENSLAHEKAELICYTMRLIRIEFDILKYVVTIIFIFPPNFSIFRLNWFWPFFTKPKITHFWLYYNRNWVILGFFLFDFFRVTCHTINFNQSERRITFLRVETLFLWKNHYLMGNKQDKNAFFVKICQPIRKRHNSSESWVHLLHAETN